jgi:superfamily II DNA or RNA helicase
MAALSKALEKAGRNNIKHTLIYATDKGPDQLTQIKDVLYEQEIVFHQITQKESSNYKLTEGLINSFKNGEIQVLTAKRVLDEGMDIPEISTAYIVASTATRRQWVQRRGRVLRKCQDPLKEFSTIHDFIVLPPQDYASNDGLQIVKDELKRVKEFASLAKNNLDPDGAAVTVAEIYDNYFLGG